MRRSLRGVAHSVTIVQTLNDVARIHCIALRFFCYYQFLLVLAVGKQLRIGAFFLKDSTRHGAHGGETLQCLPFRLHLARPALTLGSGVVLWVDWVTALIMCEIGDIAPMTSSLGPCPYDVVGRKQSGSPVRLASFNSAE